jgi:hypothetical protein
MPIIALSNLYSKTKEEIKKFEKIDPQHISNSKFEGQRYPEEVPLVHSAMLNNLYNRRVQIEGVINDHIRLLHGESALDGVFGTHTFL